MRPTRSTESASDATREWWRCPGIVYFLGAGAPPVAVKVGMLAVTSKAGDVGKAVLRRLSQIQSSNHEQLHVLGLVEFKDGEYPTKLAEDYERALHLQFQHLSRFKAGVRGAEWFTVSPELLSHITSVAAPPERFGLPASVVSRIIAGDAEV